MCVWERARVQRVAVWKGHVALAHRKADGHVEVDRVVELALVGELAAETLAHVTRPAPVRQAVSHLIIFICNIQHMCVCVHL